MQRIDFSSLDGDECVKLYLALRSRLVSLDALRRDAAADLAAFKPHAIEKFYDLHGRQWIGFGPVEVRPSRDLQGLEVRPVRRRERPGVAGV